MPQLEELRGKVESAEDLHSVVKTMKALAAINIRQYERAVESIDEYHRTVEMGFQIALRKRPRDFRLPREATGPTGSIVFGSDQGLCGQFNEQITQYTLRILEERYSGSEEVKTIAMGARVRGALEDAGVAIAASFDIPGSLAMVGDLMADLLAEVERWRVADGVERIVLFYHRPVSGTSYAPTLVTMLPLERNWLVELVGREWRLRTLPDFSMEWTELFASLVRQHLFVALYRAFVHSLASENASRLTSMQAAEKNIRDRLEELRNHYQRERQNAITSELMDIIAGFEALTGEKNT